MVLIASLFPLFSCEREDLYSFAVSKLSIGDTGPGGGTVFYVTDGGRHGLEVSNTDLSSSQTWIAPTICQSTLNGNTGTAIGSGRANTEAIIAQASHTSSAAKLCRDYTGGGKTDWFLPSKDELQAIWWNLVSDHTSANGGQGSPLPGTGFTTNYYWSSSEYDASSSWAQGFAAGDPVNGVKPAPNYVRAVRSF